MEEGWWETKALDYEALQDLTSVEAAFLPFHQAPLILTLDLRGRRDLLGGGYGEEE